MAAAAAADALVRHRFDLLAVAAAAADALARRRLDLLA
jgi:hypothetical protein